MKRTTAPVAEKARVPRGGASREAFLEEEWAILRRCKRDGEWPEMKLVNLWNRVFKRGRIDAVQEASARLMDFAGLVPEGEVDDEPLPSEIVARAHARRLP